MSWLGIKHQNPLHNGNSNSSGIQVWLFKQVTELSKKGSNPSCFLVFEKSFLVVYYIGKNVWVVSIRTQTDQIHFIHSDSVIHPCTVYIKLLELYPYTSHSFNILIKHVLKAKNYFVAGHPLATACLTLSLAPTNTHIYEEHGAS